MQKIFSIICFVLLSVTIVLGQAAVDIPMSASDGSATIQLAVGLDLTATDCIDPALGESDLPPFPPQGVFEFRFDLEPYCGEALSSYKDYRNAPSFPFMDTVQHRMIWQRSAFGLDINIQYNLLNNSSMVIQDEFGGILLNIGPFQGQGTATIPGSVPLSSAFLKMIYNGIIPVPVELSAFTADVVGEGVLLNWITATETNNRGFEIQRLQDYKIEKFQGLPDGEAGWKAIGFVQGFGTTTEPKSYSFTDENVTTGTPACQPLVGKPAGRYKYRLKQIDFDGTFQYSREIEVKAGNLPDRYSLSQNYPNPFNPSTIIEYSIPKSGKVTIKIYDLIGREVRALVNGEVQQGTHKIEWDGLNNEGRQMSSGTYIYRIVSGDFIQTKKMILLK